MWAHLCEPLRTVTEHMQQGQQRSQTGVRGGQTHPNLFQPTDALNFVSGLDACILSWFDEVRISSPTSAVGLLHTVVSTAHNMSKGALQCLLGTSVLILYSVSLSTLEA